MKASDAVAHFLIVHKIQNCFELVGGMITHLIDSFSKSGKINVISMHHEQAAAFAAEGVARQSRGKSIAIAMGTSGPGATNLITGIGSCWFDSIPCIFITGQVNTDELKGERPVRQQGFQELDIVEVVRSLTKYAVRVERPEALMPELHKAVSFALSNRMGPVLIDIPNNIQRADIPDSEVELWLSKPLAIVSEPEPKAESLEILRGFCAESRKPLVCIGGGARWSDALDDWLKAAEASGIPYVSTLMGHERVVARRHYFNMIGAYGNREANWAVQNCDLLIVVGARLDVRQTGADVDDFARNARVVQVDIDQGQLSNRVKADLNILSSSDQFFRHFVLKKELFPNLDEQWVDLLEQKRAKAEIRDEYSDWVISPSALFRKLNTALANQEVDYVCDVGIHQMWAAQNIRVQHGQAVHYSGGMGAMGFALPAALGMAVHSQRKTVVITGDGSLQVNIQELETLNRLSLDIIVIVLNNAALGMVKNFQDMYFDGRDYSSRSGYGCPSFTDVARGYGIEAHRVGNMKKLNRILPKVSSHNGPLLIEVMMEDATECRPRLVFGSKLDEQIPILDDN